MNDQSTSVNKNLLIGGVIVLVIIFGLIFFFSQRPQQGNTNAATQTQNTDEGKVLAGSSSPYIIFNKVDYDKALSSGKIVFLDFYANWCPICRGEEPAILEGFNSLSSDRLIGFRVNFNDSDTDADEEKLAKDFNIPYQHTKVILRNGKESSRYSESWTKEIFDVEITKAIQ